MHLGSTLGVPGRFPAHLLALLTLVLTQCQSTEVATSRAQRPPNIVYIMADELGYYELSCMGHANIQTPNLDRMARGGIRFTQALAGSSVCAPTRCCLLTGKHSGHTSVRSNGGGTPLRAGEETIGSVLKRAGYATGGFGKWGCGGRGSTGVPEEHGFDEFVGYYDQVHAHSYYPAYIIRNSEELRLEGNRGGREGATYSHYVIVDRAKKFIRANKDRPFFCYMPVTPPHGMFDLPADDPAWAIYRDKPWTLEARRYAAMVTMLDRQVGEVLALLRELGLEKNTLVMFGGDNGGNDYFRDAEHRRGFHAPNVDPKTGVEFRGKKGNLYQGGLLVPMLAYWPGRIAANRVSDHVWYFPDFLPTFAELAGAKVPDDIDGISIVPELLGEATAGRKQQKHEYLYWELGGQTAVRRGAWKAIQPGRNASWELYDLSRDVSEQNDIAAQHPQVLAQMQAFARAAHQPVATGTFADRADHEKDRRAKWGDAPRNQRGRGNRRAGPVNQLPKAGLISRAGWKVQRVSSEAATNGKLAENVLDGRPRTHWHTRFGEDLARHPHELVIDMGRTHEVHGFVYLCRQDRGWNGAFGRCEFFVGDAADQLGKGEPIAKATFRKDKKPQKVKCTPVKGRYFMVRVLTEVNDGPWASMAEIGALSR